jgi:hypothetical protein
MLFLFVFKFHSADCSEKHIFVCVWNSDCEFLENENSWELICFDYIICPRDIHSPKMYISYLNKAAPICRWTCRCCCCYCCVKSIRLIGSASLFAQVSILYFLTIVKFLYFFAWVCVCVSHFMPTHTCRVYHVIIAND